ncbi:MAG: hypothetical protein ABWK01_01590 [Infirmifilum sp.]
MVQWKHSALPRKPFYAIALRRSYMPVEAVLRRYLQLIKTEHFARYEKDFANKIIEGLKAGYLQGLHEPDLVSIIDRVVNNLKGMSTSYDKFKISTKSIFIHGNKSQVEFEYYGKKVQRELGDLIFILSVIYNGRKYFEKLTISQFKKDSGILSWNLSNREQLYLLSRFPPFRGTSRSIIPRREFILPNYSGCLGSYNLLFRPGDFVYVSASLLESFIGNRKCIDMSDVSRLWEQPCCDFTYPKLFAWPDVVGILGFSRCSPNVHDFVDKYLRGYIGELIYSDVGAYNRPALDFLHELLSAIMKKAEKENNEEVESFVSEFFDYPYSDYPGGMKEDVNFDYEGGGIAIIYTLIDLGGGE